GVLFGLIVLVTGPLWAKPAWGTYWTWEPRLTLMLLTWFLFVGYIVMRNYAGGDEAGRRLSAGIALMGAPATYLIHVAVKMWGGNHPTVVTEGGGGLQSPEMQLAFAVTLVAVGWLAVYFVHGRYTQHALKDAIEDLFLDLSDLEDERCAGSSAS
ncbi:MAG: cytochrome c biogenesis protein CcsA, partial [Myxococcota bacterium]|nr:cytochrome c biogenesis protein CcsA [Myxococcota bacterium]